MVSIRGFGFTVLRLVIRLRSWSIGVAQIFALSAPIIKDKSMDDSNVPSAMGLNAVLGKAARRKYYSINLKA
jgi:hypothetical protein